MIAPTSSPGAAARTPAALRAPLTLLRLPLLLWHVLVHLPIVLLLLMPFTRHWRWRGEPFQHRVIRGWQAGLMRVFGFRLRRRGTPLQGPTLFVANHVGWVDISMLHSQRMMGFVAKDEISRWPLVGWLAARGQTIFHRRGSTESLGGVLSEMIQRLQRGQSVGVFPEGGTRGGHEVGPFHARIFTAAVEAGVPVQPVALVYGERGRAQQVVAFGRRESFAANFVRLLGEPARTATVHFLEPIRPGEADGRRRMAELARARIVEAISHAP
ncbi:1-acyl-sn-glycerol-3-phosphate acyltransferase [Lysobacter sp. N42]|uniref:lysophospholipid acyltransferase family protein n=1 Tax=Lysobacter sp. N42 TaxID=2545719 RepID=UPI00104F8DC6|nr:lysophospholipid acyltransferase family protein [Lysobacter sp. N42]TCZ83625.1 1-acyl-sn-glycerol-3-phosphate acyltransferase [Lysobacter sp. N42]